MIDGLAFLPITKVVERILLLKTICASENTKIIDYVDATRAAET